MEILACMLQCSLLFRIASKEAMDNLQRIGRVPTVAQAQHHHEHDVLLVLPQMGSSCLALPRRGGRARRSPHARRRSYSPVPSTSTSTSTSTSCSCIHHLEWVATDKILILEPKWLRFLTSIKTLKYFFFFKKFLVKFTPLRM